MDMMSAAGLGPISSMADIPHGLSLSVMKKGMDAAEQVALKQLEMLPPIPPKGQYIDVYA